MKRYDSAFELLTSDAEELENYKMRSGMMNAIVDVIKENNWTQKEAADFLGVSQPRISNLKNGKMSKFSVDMLMGMLTKLGYAFEFNYTPKAQGDADMTMTISHTAESR